MNRWFWVKITGEIDLYYLVSASSKLEAAFKVAPNSENTETTGATWGSLRAFLHARIPRDYDPDLPARGSIPIWVGDQQSHIHHSI